MSWTGPPLDQCDKDVCKCNVTLSSGVFIFCSMLYFFILLLIIWFLREWGFDNHSSATRFGKSDQELFPLGFNLYIPLSAREKDMTHFSDRLIYIIKNDLGFTCVNILMSILTSVRQREKVVFERVRAIKTQNP
jgi:hypothetical protein